jgi:hypothetical protein
MLGVPRVSLTKTSQNRTVGWALPTFCAKSVGTAHPTKAILSNSSLICVGPGPACAGPAREGPARGFQSGECAIFVVLLDFCRVVSVPIFHLDPTIELYNEPHERDLGGPFHGVLARHLGVENVPLDLCQHARLERCAARDEHPGFASSSCAGRAFRRFVNPGGGIGSGCARSVVDPGTLDP